MRRDPAFATDAVAAAGPVAGAAQAALARDGRGSFLASMAERSPVGPKALRICTAGPEGKAACAELAAWLASQPWVGASASRPPNVYVRVALDAFEAWVIAGVAAPTFGRGCEGVGARVRLHFREPEVTASDALQRLRQSLTGRALASMLTSRGFAVASEPELSTADVASRELCPQLSVGGVDIVHGPLRARLGGAAGSEDLKREIFEHLRKDCGSPDRCDAYAELALAMLLLRTEPSGHVRLDDARLQAECSMLGAIVTALALPEQLSPSSQLPEPVPTRIDSEGVLREVLADLDEFPRIAARAASHLDPSLVLRCVRSLAERTIAAAPHIPAGDPLWRAIATVMNLGFELLALDLGANSAASHSAARAVGVELLTTYRSTVSP
jgi:hypothetical protein